MNRQQYLLLKLMEEACEVSQIASKTIQFGLTEKHPALPNTNQQRCYEELDDLTAIVLMLNEECNFGYSANMERIQTKIDKVNKYYQYSVDLGKVQHGIT